MENPYLNTLLWAAGTAVFIVLSSLVIGNVARWVVAQRGGTEQRQGSTFAGYFFASPWLTGFFIFVVGPMLASLYWSFTNFRVPEPAEWVGLENYTRLLTSDDDFRAALINTLFLTIIGVPLQMFAALGLALLLNQGRRGERFFRAAFYMPVVLGLNAAALLAWRLMLNANNGLVNTTIRGLRDNVPGFGLLNRAFIWVMELSNALFLGLQQWNFTLLEKTWMAGFPGPDRVPLWLQSPLWTKTSIILLMVWGCGAMMLIFLAALYNVPREVYEAAEVDGANGWQKFRYITLALISPATFYNLIVGTIAAIQIFEQTYVLYRDSPTVAVSAYSVVYYLWRATFRFNDMGYGSAISWLLLLIILGITLVQFRLQDRWVQYDLK